MVKKRWAVFISGRGSNLKRVLDFYGDSNIFVFTNKKNAKGLAWAIKRGVCVEALHLKEKKDWSALAERLNFLNISKVLLLGFMKIVPSNFLGEFEGSVVNLHPSLLPHFKGLDSIKRSLRAGHSVGASLHFVNEKMDEGPLIMQSALPLKTEFKDHEFETRRVHALEQRLVSTYLRLGGL